MKLIYSGRQTRRTTELIKRCGEYRYALIVCPTKKQADYVFKMSLGMGVNIPMPITFRDFIEGGFFSPNIDAFLIDNLDDCLNTCTKGVPIDSVVFEKKGGKLHEPL